MRWHVLSSGRMCSLRQAMLVWLVPLFLVVGAGSAALSYWTYNRMVGSFMDEQMEQLAQSIALQDEHLALRRADPQRVHESGVYIAQVWAADGRLDATSLPAATVAMSRTEGFDDVAEGDRRWRVYTTGLSPTGKRVQVLQSADFRRKLAVERAGAALAPVLILLPLALLILWGVAAKLSREIREVGEQVARQDLHAGDLPPARVPSEIAPLVDSFNTVLGRLREAFLQQRRFVQDAAHELRTPITAVALQLENVRRDMPPGACQQSFSQLEAGVGRAQRLVDQMLKLSRNEATAPEAPAQVDLQAQIQQSVGGLIALADQRSIDLGVVVDESARRGATVRCSTGDLRSVLDNLIENALRYTPEGGVVDVRLAGTQAGPVVEVVDTGPGIATDQLPHVFDRFFRVPGTVARGSGLGLSIAQGAAQRCGLRVVLRNRTDRSGLVARIEPAC